MLVAGVDGCRGGWSVVTLTVIGGEPIDATCEVIRSFDDIAVRVRAGALRAVGVDMPIGLPDAPPRRADVEARARLGRRRSSLFPTPHHAVLDAIDHADALARCRRAGAPGLSVQAFNLLPKIREVRAALTADVQPSIAEVHPETSFAALGDGPCRHPKRTAAGAAERIARLRPWLPHIDALVARRPRGAALDDVLDATAAAWTAQRIAQGSAEWLGDAGVRDPRGFRLTIAV